MDMAAAALLFFVLPMLATAGIASLASVWCGSRRRMVVLVVFYLVAIVLPQYLVARHVLLPADPEYDPGSPSNAAWAVAGTLLVRMVELGYGPGRLFWRCWKHAGRSHRGS